MTTLHNSIYKVINYKFIKDSLLEEALTHPSANKRNSKKQIINYERLEFLGDSILNMVISQILFKLFPEEKEGALAKRKTHLVCGTTITNVAQEIGLSDFIIMNNNMSCNIRKFSSRNLENALEALIGAIYIDGGFQHVEQFIAQYWEKLAKNTLLPPQDSKTSLQEWTQKHILPLPKYTVIKQTGPAHNPEFTISVYIKGYDNIHACDYSKKSAEQKAAKRMLDQVSLLTHFTN
ncbi:ribonuclease III [Wolbachia endosymbiont of Howardula sp.]|uniref:ribonuclease III n=1 Tax=Wolbachia endosymbiont of Howardula sp. TaxID=2916816 RepID=UPI00217EA89A|nr:ribonuclease III [Wolbachia endosymbiont of Howardula sp.]UWI83001.1 ribonuclease III [Wolbachia endosymbiont of Howardula sp.]